MKEIPIQYPNIKDFLQLDIQPDIKSDSFIDHLLHNIDETIKQKDRILILTLTKKSSEEITNFMLSKGYKAFYLHSEIDTMDRWEIVKKLKNGTIDILVGVNLLREGIDLPEVGFIAILDADKQGFLRSTTALVQNIGRAARNPHSHVALYADTFTPSILTALRETYRRRKKQQEYNTQHNITPTHAQSNIKSLSVVKTDEKLEPQQFSVTTKGKVKRLKRMTKKEKALITKDLREQLENAIKERRFEEAALIRDQIKEIEEE